MNKYIKAQDAIDAFARYIWSPLPRSISYADLVVEKIPAADVAPIIHGHWMSDNEDIKWGNSLIKYSCSNCKKRAYWDKEQYKFILFEYCPFCGAKMDGGKNE